MKVIQCTLAAALCAATPALAGSDIIAVGWLGDAYAIDSGTGVGVLLGATGFSQLNGMAKAPDGTIYTSSGLSPISIIRIDPKTGAGTLVVYTDLESCRGLAFANDGRLFAIQLGFFGGDILSTIDLEFGRRTIVGHTGMLGIRGLAVDPTTGRMYGWDVGSRSRTGAGLVVVDMNTGVATDVDPNTPGSNSIHGLGFDASGNLFGARDSLFSLDLNTGAATFIGTGGYSDVRGIVFLDGGGGFTIRLSGPCPGQTTLSWSGAGSGQMGVLVGNGAGNYVIPSGPCSGTQLGLSGPGGLLLHNVISTQGGSGQVTATVGTQACGKWVQCIKTDDCSTSNATGPI